MSVREYIGARYVPVFADPVTWDRTKSYEALTMVTWEGNTYTSRQPVPAGIEITNTSYWILTGNYNAQVETYRQEVARLAQDMAGFDGKVEEETEARKETDTQLAADIAAETAARAKADTQLAGDIAAETAAREDLEAKTTIIKNEMLLKSHELQGARPIYRYEVPFPYSTQGNCYFESQGRRFWALAYYNRETTNTPSISVVDLDANITYTIPGPFAHCNQIDYDRYNKVLIVSGVIDADNIRHCLTYDMTVPQAPALISDTAFDSLWLDIYMPLQVFSLDKDTYGVLCRVTGSTGMIALCTCDTAFTNHVFKFSVQVPRTNIANVAQTMVYDHKTDSIMYTLFNKTQFYSLDGNQKDSITYAKHYSYVSTNEVESINEFNGKYYFGCTYGTRWVSGTSYIESFDEDINVLSLFVYDPTNPDAKYPATEFSKNLTFFLNSNADGTADNNNTFKYPADLINALHDNAGKDITVRLQTDIPFVIPIVANCKIWLSNYKCKGLMIYANATITGGNNFAADPSYSKIKTPATRGSLPVMAYCWPGTVVNWSGITPPAGDYYVMIGINSIITGNNQLYANGNWTHVCVYGSPAPQPATALNTPQEV